MYKIDFSDFFSSAFSVDCLIFGYSEGKIKTLLIKRAIDPYKDYWAIPGDLVYPDEDLPDAAERILPRRYPTRASHVLLLTPEPIIATEKLYIRTVPF